MTDFYRPISSLTRQNGWQIASDLVTKWWKELESVPEMLWTCISVQTRNFINQCFTKFFSIQKLSSKKNLLAFATLFKLFNIYLWVFLRLIIDWRYARGLKRTSQYIYIALVYKGGEVNDGILALKQVLKGRTGCKYMIGMIQPIIGKPPNAETRPGKILVFGREKEDAPRVDMGKRER